MIRGLYSSALGMLALTSKQDVISNNLANANTAGYKKDYISVVSFPEALVYAQNRYSGSRFTETPVGYLSPGVGIGETGFIGGNGVVRQTGGIFDLALSGDGFFAVSTPNGEMYTRNGNFSKDSQGRLITQDGNFVMGEKGPVVINGNEVFIDVAGRVMVDGQYLDTLKIRSFGKGELEKMGSNTFAANATGKLAQSVTIRQGFLEGSNVDATQEMVDMMVTVRAFEANQRILKTQDEILGRAVNEVGRLG